MKLWVLLMLAAAPPEGFTSPHGQIRVLAMSDAEDVKEAPQLRLEGTAQQWTVSAGHHWVHRPGRGGLRTIEVRAPLGAPGTEDDGARIGPFVAPMAEGVEILIDAGVVAASGPSGPRCLFVDAPESERSKWRLCDADSGLPMRAVIDLGASGTCPRPAMSPGGFHLARESAGSIEFFDTLPGLYRVEVSRGQVRLTFVGGAASCRKLAMDAPWMDLQRWRSAAGAHEGD
jgi:hypothetical protein